MNKYLFDEYTSGNVYDTTPTNRIDLPYLLHKIKFPTLELVETVEQIRKAKENKQEQLKTALKATLPYYTPCVQVQGGRGYVNITGFTGLTVLDFDKLDSTNRAYELRNTFFEEYKWIIAGWVSPSGNGVKFIVKIPVVNNVAEYKAHYYALMELFEFNPWFDPCNLNAVLPLYYSYDTDLIVRTDAIEFTDTLEIEQEPIVNPEDYIFNFDEKGVEDAINHVSNTIDLIEVNGPGHQLLRTASFTAGNYARWGFFDLHEANVIMGNLIYLHPYLSKKANTYKKSADDGIKWGFDHPTEIKNKYA